MSLSPKELATIATKAAMDKKAINPIVLDINEISVISDFFLICSGNSSIQVKAIADNIEDKLKDAGERVIRREGMQDARWVLLDYGSLVAHIFLEEERYFYNLERLWRDAKTVTI